MKTILAFSILAAMILPTTADAMRLQSPSGYYSEPTYMDAFETISPRQYTYPSTYTPIYPSRNIYEFESGFESYYRNAPPSATQVGNTTYWSIGRQSYTCFWLGTRYHCN